MKYENYYETLTPMQKLKWEEKKVLEVEISD